MNQFLSIMSRLDNIATTDVDFSAENIYQDIRNTFLASRPIDVLLPTTNAKHHLCANTKPNRIQPHPVELKTSSINVALDDNNDFKLVFRKQANEYVHDWMSSVQQTKTQLAEKHNQILDQQPLSKPDDGSFSQNDSSSTLQASSFSSNISEDICFKTKEGNTVKENITGNNFSRTHVSDASQTEQGQSLQKNKKPYRESACSNIQTQATGDTILKENTLTHSVVQSVNSHVIDDTSILQKTGTNDQTISRKAIKRKIDNSLQLSGRMPHKMKISSKTDEAPVKLLLAPIEIESLTKKPLVKKNHVIQPKHRGNLNVKVRKNANKIELIPKQLNVNTQPCNDPSLKLVNDKSEKTKGSCTVKSDKSIVETIERVTETSVNDIQSQTKELKEQQSSLCSAIEQLREVSKIYSDITKLKGQQKDCKQDENIQSKIETMQMEHDVKLNQIQSSIAIAEINAKIQAQDVQSKYELGLGKLKLEEWKAQLQSVLSRETQGQTQSHDFQLMKMRADIEREKQQQKDWYVAQESERERIFKKELQDIQHSQVIQKDNIEKQFKQFQEQQRQDHEARLKERAEMFAIEMQKLKSEQALFIEERHKIFARQIENDKQDYEVHMLKIKEDFNRDRDERKHIAEELSQTRSYNFEREMERDKMIFSVDMCKIKQEFEERMRLIQESSNFEKDTRKQQFSSEQLDRKLQTTHALANQKDNMEKYKADLMAQIKSKQIEKQDENEKLKIQMKMAEYELKLQGATMKASFNKYLFKLIPSPVTTFEYQLEKSAETAPYSIIRTFEQLWNVQYDQSLDILRLNKFKKELATCAKKAVENYSSFATYLTQDVPHWMLNARLNYCAFLKRPGMFMFKTAPNFVYSRKPLTECQLKQIDMRRAICGQVMEFSVPRYTVYENHLIDNLEFMTTQLVFPQNTQYNIDVSLIDSALVNDMVISLPELNTGCVNVDQQMFASSICKDSQLQKRSRPIYMTENTSEANKRCQYSTGVQIFV